MARTRPAVHRHRHRSVQLLLALLGADRVSGHGHRGIPVPCARSGTGGGAAGQAWLETRLRVAVRAGAAGGDPMYAVRSVRQHVRAAGDRHDQRPARPVQADLRLRKSVHEFRTAGDQQPRQRNPQEHTDLLGHRFRRHGPEHGIRPVLLPAEPHDHRDDHVLHLRSRPETASRRLPVDGAGRTAPLPVRLDRQPGADLIRPVFPRDSRIAQRHLHRHLP